LKRALVNWGASCAFARPSAATPHGPEGLRACRFACVLSYFCFCTLLFILSQCGVTNYLDSHSNMAYAVLMIDKKLSSDLLRGHTDTIILKLLADGDKYGYEVTKLVYEHSKQHYELKEATMYSSLKRLENDGHIISYWGDETQGGRRKYYRITNTGEDLYKVNKQNWDYAKQILDELL
jgi:PadR family transcriptional regulator, regulatory protein PadR